VFIAIISPAIVRGFVCLTVREWQSVANSKEFLT